MDALITAQLTGWCAFHLDQLSMKFYEGLEAEYVLPVTWKDQKDGLRPKCMRVAQDRMFAFQLKDISVNGKNASGYLDYFRDAEIVSAEVTLKGSGKKDLQFTQIILDDGPRRVLILPKIQADPEKILYRTYPVPGKLSNGFPRAVRVDHGHFGFYFRHNKANHNGIYMLDCGDEKELPLSLSKIYGCDRMCLLHKKVIPAAQRKKKPSAKPSKTAGKKVMVSKKYTSLLTATKKKSR